MLHASRFTLTLPLIGDGRPAWGQLRDDAGRASVEWSAEGHGSTTGRLHLVDNVCLIRWTPDSAPPLPAIKLTAPRFNPGDTVCLRPLGEPVCLYRVTRTCPAATALVPAA